MASSAWSTRRSCCRVRVLVWMLDCFEGVPPCRPTAVNRRHLLPRCVLWAEGEAGQQDGDRKGVDMPHPPPCAPPPRSATCSSRAARRTVAQRHALQPTSGSERRVRGWVRWRPGPELRRRWPCGTVDSSVCERLAVYRRHGGGHLHHPDRWHLATLRWCRLSHPPLQLAAAAANVPPLRRCCQIVLLPLLPLPHHPFLWLPLATISYPTGGSSPSPGSPAGCLWLGTFPFSM